MKERFMAIALPVALAFFAFASLPDDNAVAATDLGNLGEKISRTVNEAVNEAVAAAKAEARRAQEAAAEAGGDAVEPAPGEAVLSLEGTPGTAFSARCNTGGEVRIASGEVPARYVVPLDGEGIECEIRKTDPDGTLKVVFAASGARSVQSTTGVGSMINIAYGENGSFSSSTVSGGGSSSVVSSSSATAR